MASLLSINQYSDPGFKGAFSVIETFRCGEVADKLCLQVFCDTWKQIQEKKIDQFILSYPLYEFLSYPRLCNTEIYNRAKQYTQSCTTHHCKIRSIGFENKALLI